MGFTEIVLLWWLMIGLYYVLDTFMQDLADQDSMGKVIYHLVRKIVLLPVMPLFVVISIIFERMVIIGASDESEEQED
jgi:hypothetical protein